MRVRSRILISVLFLVVLFSVSQVGAASQEYLNYTEDFVDNNNDDNLPTHKGTHSVFADLQDYGANYDQMQEEDTAGISYERTIPDGETFVLTELTGAYTDVDDDPDSPDGLWLLATSGVIDTSVEASLTTPTSNPATGADLQEFRVLVRQYSQTQTGTPSARIELWENGILIRAGSLEDVPKGAGIVLSFTWNANELGTADGSLVECYVFGKKSGGGPPARNSIEVGAIEWNVATGGVGTNYELDLEVGWESADYDESNEWLCIYPVTGGGWPTEDLKVDVWTGSWTNVFADLTPDQWNNISISSYLTDATFEMRFLGGTESGDSTQDTWEIDAVLITTYSIAYTEDVFETLPLSDSSPVSMGASVTIFEQIDFSETITISASFAITVLEVLGLAATAIVTKGVGGIDYLVTIFEVIGASESVTPSMGASVTLLETIGFIDITAAFRGVSITVFENILMSSSTATSQLTHYYVYEVFGIISSVGVVGGVIPTPPTGSMFYQLFFGLDMWGYIGPLALVIIGYIVASKDKNLGVIWFVLESLVIANYLTLVAETPDYWWHIFILLIGCMSTLMYSIRDRW